jgi:hypothetical protein
LRTYNFKDHVSGNTFNGQGFRIVVNGSPVDLSGAFIKMQLKTSPSAVSALTLDSDSHGITIDETITGRFVIDEQRITAPASVYLYDIQITFSDLKEKTYIRGEWNIIQDITT